MNKTAIPWAQFTWNPVTGCTHASEGCKNCYAEKMANRLVGMGNKRYAGVSKNGKWTGLVRCHEELLQEPLRRRKPAKIFVCSMSDLYHPSVPDEFIDRVKAIEALCPQHTFIELTKRPERAAEYLGRDEVGYGISRAVTKLRLPSHLACIGADTGWAQFVSGVGVCGVTGGVGAKSCWPLPNVWLGTTVENQEAIPRIAELLKCPAAVRFLSVEPMLGPVLIPPFDIDWVICGPETGPGKRPMGPDWAIDLYQQCKDARVPFFWKGDGIDELDDVHEMPRAGGFRVEEDGSG